MEAVEGEMAHVLSSFRRKYGIASLENRRTTVRYESGDGIDSRCPELVR